jgi:membrane-associated protease RseP (regulator of RpoE activity)
MVGMQGMPGGLRLPFPMPGQEGERGNAPFDFPLPDGVQQNGVVIGEVTKDSPAEKAGLKQGDLITAANDKAIAAPQDVVDLVRASKPGDTVVLSVQRQGEEKPLEITVTLGENPDNTGAAFMGVALGSFIRMERTQPGNEGSLEILPGFRLPFDFGSLPFAMPTEPDPNSSEL